MLKGSIVAIVTPFKKGKVDERALGDLIEWHISQGTNGIVPCGTTGEASTHDYKERYRVIEITIKTVNKRVPVIAGTGANETDETIMITKQAKKSGADAALLVSPYYNNPTQEGLYRHYKAVAEAVDIPLVLYNVPGRTAVNILPATVARLAEIENVVAIKEATGDTKQVSEVIRLCGNRITVVSGDDFTTLTILALGGKGVISVSANVATASPRVPSAAYGCALRISRRGGDHGTRAALPCRPAARSEDRAVPRPARQPATTADRAHSGGL